MGGDAAWIILIVERLWRSLKYEEVYLKDYESVTKREPASNDTSDSTITILPVLQSGAPALEPRIPDTGGDLPGASGMIRRKGKGGALLDSGTLSPDPWDLSHSRQNGCITLKAIARRTGLRRDATRAPMQGPEWQGGLIRRPKLKPKTSVEH
jgi:hypothetical protein